MNISCVSYDTQVSDLQAGHTYRLRVLAVNEAGVGCPSLPTEPVTAQTPAGQPSRLHTFSTDWKNKTLSLRASGSMLDLNPPVHLCCQYIYTVYVIHTNPAVLSSLEEKRQYSRGNNDSCE